MSPKQLIEPVVGLLPPGAIVGMNRRQQILVGKRILGLKPVPAKMELFLREEFRPQRAPGLGERAEIARPDFVVFGIAGGRHPGLRAFHEHMRDRPQPAGVIERPGANLYPFPPPFPSSSNPPPA